MLYVDSLDRLGRNYDGIIQKWKQITREINADIIVLENASLFDSRKFKEMGDMGRFMEDQFLSLLSYIAEQERKKIRQRQLEGIALAKENGVPIGRPKIQIPENFGEVYLSWEQRKLKAVQAFKILGLKKAIFYNKVKLYEGRENMSGLNRKDCIPTIKE